MSSPIVEQLESGLVVRCADGTEITVRPISLRAARAIIVVWPAAFAVDPVPADPAAPTDAERAAIRQVGTDRVAARLAIIDAFATEYPDLADKLSFGDLVRMAPDFFWSATGAAVISPVAPSPTGTPSGSPTVPAGETSPT